MGVGFHHPVLAPVAVQCQIDAAGAAIVPTEGIFKMIIYLDVTAIGPPVVSLYCPQCGDHTKRIVLPNLEFDVRHYPSCTLDRLVVS